ncbi:hypothetical protein CCGE525_09000 [Rhizobium jaguaris]|uniref:DUF2946 domain-containing protein n=1 Tax=Rhizobium jaguaris TaxID=1312183 RepID=A0A387FKS5_9HYPH|nr:hypothetical protein CCGE525_09000 [Rhizobium jaguaris]
MAADRRRFAWTNAVLTVLVALALLFAPTAGAQAMQCHERPVHGYSRVEHIPTQKDANASLQGGFHTPDHKSCCAVPCGFCIVLTSTERIEVPAPTVSFLRFAWADQSGTGLALPPTLGPPRLPV